MKLAVCSLALALGLFFSEASAFYESLEDSGLISLGSISLSRGKRGSKKTTKATTTTTTTEPTTTTTEEAFEASGHKEEEAEAFEASGNGEESDDFEGSGGGEGEAEGEVATTTEAVTTTEAPEEKTTTEEVSTTEEVKTTEEVTTTEEEATTTEEQNITEEQTTAEEEVATEEQSTTEEQSNTEEQSTTAEEQTTTEGQKTTEEVTTTEKETTTKEEQSTTEEQRDKTTTSETELPEENVTEYAAKSEILEEVDTEASEISETTLEAETEEASDTEIEWTTPEASTNSEETETEASEAETSELEAEVEAHESSELHADSSESSEAKVIPLFKEPTRPSHYTTRFTCNAPSTPYTAHAIKLYHNGANGALKCLMLSCRNVTFPLDEPPTSVDHVSYGCFNCMDRASVAKCGDGFLAGLVLKKNPESNLLLGADAICFEREKFLVVVKAEESSGHSAGAKTDSNVKPVEKQRLCPAGQYVEGLEIIDSDAGILDIRPLCRPLPLRSDILTSPFVLDILTYSRDVKCDSCPPQYLQTIQVLPSPLRGQRSIDNDKGWNAWFIRAYFAQLRAINASALNPDLVVAPLITNFFPALGAVEPKALVELPLGKEKVLTVKDWNEGKCYLEVLQVAIYCGARILHRTEFAVVNQITS